MKIFVLFPTYIVWHYTTAIKDMKRVTDNLLWFIFNFFSMDILLKTLFSPWRKLDKDETVKKPSFFSNLLVNILMRISGFVIRVSTLLFGLATFVLACIVFIFGFLIWVSLPFLSVILLLYGISYLI